VLGTVAYLSPEQAIGGDTGPQSDIYSLAVVAFEMLGGRLPYLYKSITELAMKQRDELPTPLVELNPVVPVELDRTIRVALGYDPNLRFATAREFANAMRMALQRRESEFVTKVLSDPAAATRMMAARGRESERTRVAPVPVRAAAGADAATAMTQVANTPERSTGNRPAARPPASRKTSTRLAVAALLIVAVIAAGVAGVMLGDSKPSPVHQDTVQSQIDGMRGFIHNHSQ
jgi:serine/threonine-protein kinase